MVDDVLTEARPHLVNTNAPAPGASLPAYEAFRVGSVVTERLEIRQALGAWHAPAYRYLMDIHANGRFGTRFVLLYSFMEVEVTGNSMQPILHAIQSGTCAFIQDFHPNEFISPQPGVPIITGIKMVVKEIDEEQQKRLEEEWRRRKETSGTA